jgi:AraC-like DNA-binding protein
MSQIDSVSVGQEVGPGALTAWSDALIARIGRVPLSAWDQKLTGCVPAGGRRFSGHIECGALGEIVLAKVGTNSPHRVSLWPRESLTTQSAPVAVLFQTSGVCRLEQPSSSCTLYPGDWCIADTKHPLQERFFGTLNSQFVLRMERPCDSELLALLESGAAHRWDGTIGVARILRATLEQTFDEINSLRLVSETGLQRALTEMTWSAVREQLQDPPCFAQEERQRARIKSYIESQLADAELTVETIARACAMSVRSVHRAFSDASAGSVSKHIWLRRLSRCAATLRDPRQAHRPITDICLSWGFNSTSHFSRLFKERFGLTPREYRVTEATARSQVAIAAHPLRGFAAHRQDCAANRQ